MGAYSKPMIKAMALVNPTVPQFATAYDQCKPMERKFVDAFVATENPLKAVVAMNSELANKPSLQQVRAFDMLKRPLVQAAIAERRKRIADRFAITAENVAREVALLAFARMGDYVVIDEHGEPYIDMNKIPESEREDRLAAIAEVTVEDFMDGRGEDAREIRKVKFKLHDKLSALDKLTKMVGGYAPEQLQISGPNGEPIQTRNVTVTMSAEEAAAMWAKSLEEE